MQHFAQAVTLQTTLFAFLKPMKALWNKINLRTLTKMCYKSCSRVLYGLRGEVFAQVATHAAYNWHVVQSTGRCHQRIISIWWQKLFLIPLAYLPSRKGLHNSATKIFTLSDEATKSSLRLVEFKIRIIFLFEKLGSNYDRRATHGQVPKESSPKNLFTRKWKLHT